MTSMEGRGRGRGGDHLEEKEMRDVQIETLRYLISFPGTDLRTQEVIQQSSRGDRPQKRV